MHYGNRSCNSIYHSTSFNHFTHVFILHILIHPSPFVPLFSLIPNTHFTHHLSHFHKLTAHRTHFPHTTYPPCSSLNPLLSLNLHIPIFSIYLTLCSSSLHHQTITQTTIYTATQTTTNSSTKPPTDRKERGRDFRERKMAPMLQSSQPWVE